MWLLQFVIMADETVRRSRDWVSSPRAHVLAWWIPKAVIIAGLFVPTPERAAMWIVALIWMGTACVLNSRRCGRAVCRYTGPYYIAMIAPVLVLISGLVSVGSAAWIALAVLIIGGGFTVWWATERILEKRAACCR